jgi:RNA polymerase sigma factor (sigma-70 family)
MPRPTNATKPEVPSSAPDDRRWPSEDRGVPEPPPAPSLVPEDPVSDEALIVAHAAGDPAAFPEIYRRYLQPLLRLMVRQHRIGDDAHDLVQQTFLQVHRARADFDPSRRFRPWLYTIALNLSREGLRKRQRRPTVWNESPGLPEPTAAGLAPDDTQVARHVRVAIAALPRDQREVIELHWFDGFTFQEIAQCLGMPANTAKVRAHRGYKKLRESLQHLVA